MWQKIGTKFELRFSRAYRTLQWIKTRCKLIYLTDLKGKQFIDPFFLNKHHSFILTKCSWLAILMAQFLTHCVKYWNLTLTSWCGNFLERHVFCIVSGDSPETMQKLCLSTKFPHQEIRWNYGIFCNGSSDQMNILKNQSSQTTTRAV